MLTALTALLLAGPASAQGWDFIVDGDPMDWGALDRFDEYADVVPDTNSTVDLLGCSLRGGGVFAGGDTLFTFLFQFAAPPFQGADETTVEIFFDLSHSDSYGVEQGPWSDFRPDYVVGVTGSNGALTKEFYWRYTGSAWDKKEEADIPQVDMAFATRYLEGALDWKLLDIPDTDVPYYELRGAYNQLKAVRVSKGVYRDFLPNGDQALSEQTLPSVDPDCYSRYRDISWDIKCPSSVEANSWGRIKGP